MFESLGKPKTHLAKIFTGLDSLDRLNALKRDYEQKRHVETNPILGRLVNLDETVILQEFTLEGMHNIVPIKRHLPGTVALWGQLSGKATVRAGNSLQRQRGINITRGDVVQITGRGKRSVENPSQDLDCIGLLVSIVPIEYTLDFKVTPDHANDALALLQDQNPELTPQVRVYMDELRRGICLPAVAYGYAQRHLKLETDTNIAS